MPWNISFEDVNIWYTSCLTDITASSNTSRKNWILHLVTIQAVLARIIIFSLLNWSTGSLCLLKNFICDKAPFRVIFKAATCIHNFGQFEKSFFIIQHTCKSNITFHVDKLRYHSLKTVGLVLNIVAIKSQDWWVLKSIKVIKNVKDGTIVSLPSSFIAFCRQMSL